MALLLVAGQNQEIQLVTVSGPSALTPSDVSAIALDFKVLHPVVITRLGVFPSCGPWPQLQGNVTVKLLQLDQEEAVVTARFSAVTPGTMEDGVWYKPVEQFILPKGFEGTLVWESLDSGGLSTVNSSSVELSDGGGVLKISSVSEGTLPHRSALGFPGLAGGFTFTIYDEDGLLGLLQGRGARMEQRALALRREDSALRQESLRHGDMVFVDVVDTYRNVPSKLLQFYKWYAHVDDSIVSLRTARFPRGNRQPGNENLPALQKVCLLQTRLSVTNAHFNLLLKTDDDCYIDVDAVLMKIDRKRLKRSNLWWGNFRQSWAVDRIGKWQELEYASPAYPAFACGSGYGVSRDLVEWLAGNADQLKAYQGEDVSMGIWMAAVGPQKYQDPGWLCEKECYLDMLSSPQHSGEELHALWARKEACGDPCGC
ncbi:unnamed protein product, partial [Tetraodon nigroviridis]